MSKKLLFTLRPALTTALASPISAAHTTQRNGPGQAFPRKQYKHYDQMGQQCQEGGALAALKLGAKAYRTCAERYQ